MTELQDIIAKARAHHPYWCKLARKNGPDPREIHMGGGYAHFIRFPWDRDFNAWCFSTMADRNRFIRCFKATPID